MKESDILGLAGKTIYFNDTTIHPIITYNANLVSPIWYSDDTANTSYYVKITGVTYLKNDTTLGWPLRTYVATGSCAAVLSQGNSTVILNNGSFNFIISRTIY